MTVPYQYSMVSISSERVQDILHEELGMRKLSARRTTIDQKPNSVVTSKQYLNMFKRNGIKPASRKSEDNYLQNKDSALAAQLDEQRSEAKHIGSPSNMTETITVDLEALKEAKWNVCTKSHRNHRYYCIETLTEGPSSSNHWKKSEIQPRSSQEWTIIRKGRTRYFCLAYYLRLSNNIPLSKRKQLSQGDATITGTKMTKILCCPKPAHAKEVIDSYESFVSENDEEDRNPKLLNENIGLGNWAFIIAIQKERYQDNS
ncbi:hypothetical protein Trydic_g20965 [Trypoxylus dichotomus]